MFPFGLCFGLDCSWFGLCFGLNYLLVCVCFWSVVVSFLACVFVVIQCVVCCVVLFVVVGNVPLLFSTLFKSSSRKTSALRGFFLGVPRVSFFVCRELLLLCVLGASLFFFFAHWNQTLCQLLGIRDFLLIVAGDVSRETRFNPRVGVEGSGFLRFWGSGFGEMFRVCQGSGLFRAQGCLEFWGFRVLAHQSEQPFC